MIYITDNHKFCFKGREDGFSSPDFKCESCNFIKKPIASDYMAADYWPGSLPTISSVVHGSALKQWQLLMFEAPGTSQGKCIAVYDNIAYSNDLVRNGTILYHTNL